MYFLRSGDSIYVTAGRAGNGRKSASFSGLFPSFDDVVVAFNILRLVEKLGAAFVAFVLVGTPNSGLAAGGIVEDSLAGNTLGTGYDKVPFKGFTVF